MNITRFTTLCNVFISASMFVAEGKDVSNEPELMLKVYKDVSAISESDNNIQNTINLEDNLFPQQPIRKLPAVTTKGKSNKRDKYRLRDEDLIKIIQEIENGYRFSPIAQSSTLPPIPAPIEYLPPLQAPVNLKPTNSPIKNNQNKPTRKPNNSNQSKPTNKPNNNNPNNKNEPNNNKPNKSNESKPTIKPIKSNESNPTNKPNNNNQNKPTKKPTKKPTNNNQNKNKNSTRKPTKRPTKNKNSPTSKPNKNNSNNNPPSLKIEGRSKIEKDSTKIQLIPLEEVSQDLFCETAYHRASDSLGSCFEINNKGGCSNIKCEEMVCKTIGDSFCCDAIWDENCVESAKVFCAHDTTGIFAQTSSCYSYTNLNEPGCTNKACEKFVCDMLPGCCSFSWNWDCVVAAFDYCCLEDFEN